MTKQEYIKIELEKYYASNDLNEDMSNKRFIKSKGVECEILNMSVDAFLKSTKSMRYIDLKNKLGL